MGGAGSGCEQIAVCERQLRITALSPRLYYLTFELKLSGGTGMGKPTYVELCRGKRITDLCAGKQQEVSMHVRL